MKEVLISIQPKWVEKIASGEKTIEVRKTAPKIETPFKCYIYCTYGNMKENYGSGKRGKVIGEFVCDYIIKAERGHYVDLAGCKINGVELLNYADGKPLYGLHISDLKIYDKPKELSEFRKLGKEYHDIRENEKGYLTFLDGYIEGEPLTRPPQSWCYVEKV